MTHWKRRLPGGRSAVLAFLLLAACSSPDPNLYILAALPGPQVNGTIRSLELRRIGLAGYLDRSGIVRQDSPYRLSVAEIDRWGEPVASMLDRVLTENLVQRLPNTAVFAESSAISSTPQAVLEVAIQRLDPDMDGTVVLLAQVAIRRDQGRSSGSPTSRAQAIRITVQPASASTQDLVAAESQALAQLADRIAGMLKT